MTNSRNVPNPLEQLRGPGRRDVLRLMGIGAAVGAVGFTIQEGGIVARPASAIAGRNIYVRAGAGTGTAQDGTTPEKAFGTLQAASNITTPGDTVLIMNGTYIDNGNPGNSGTLNITRSGQDGLPITYAAYPGHTPVITVTRESWAGIRITGADYITIEGLTLAGLNAELVYADAYAARLQATPTYNASGISIQLAQGDTSTVGSHHIIVRNNVIHSWPGGGVAAVKADYLTVNQNTIFNNAWYSIFANSGVSTLVPSNFNTNTGNRNFFTRNLVYGNKSNIPWRDTGKISDGNGIIVDSTLGLESGGVRYQGRTLVSNNVVFNNGGSGIHAYKANNVDIINNTGYFNSASSTLNYGNIGAWESQNCNVLNNVSYVRTGKSTNSKYNNVNVRYDYNIYFNGATPEVLGPQDDVANPLFYFPSTVRADSDFRINSGSPAIGTGTAQLAPSVDFTGATRPAGGVDRGAYRYGATTKGY
ncbi:right-handed parallel beta-helix repeat-containing protein [Arthrobacter sp. YN]|uniref:right-handed parallel beta-helix repeat-containing protein n=1 Tax=Arthrobacter sp. YN TaxID=2020486 RepID=UPI000B6141B7|nr:right-handed parallel beta-helix repeat-containing protein [Arthrobacter sp. YN]ASN18324.1 hypothetical protein CGK93_00280 [Arthrobacter sp. YN]